VPAAAVGETVAVKVTLVPVVAEVLEAARVVVVLLEICRVPLQPVVRTGISPNRNRPLAHKSFMVRASSRVSKGKKIAGSLPGAVRLMSGPTAHGKSRFPWTRLETAFLHGLHPAGRAGRRSYAHSGGSPGTGNKTQ